MVDFRAVFPLYLRSLEQLARSRPQRLRVRSPYRFEIARRFAQKVSRIPFSDELGDWKAVQKMMDD